jgi:hypothetical protein
VPGTTGAPGRPGAPEAPGQEPSGLGDRLGVNPGGDDPESATTHQPGRRGIWGVDHTTAAPSGLTGAAPTGLHDTAPSGLTQYRPAAPDDTSDDAGDDAADVPRWSDDPADNQEKED